jgi:hypothetical protein
MTVPLATDGPIRDKQGQVLHVGDVVRVDGLPDQAEVQAADARYGVVVVLVPGRSGKVGRMVKATEVQRTP